MELLVHRHRARVARVLEIARRVSLRALLPTHLGEAQVRLLPLPTTAHEGARSDSLPHAHAFFGRGPSF
eukprot:scaffold21401_cov116-Isochrysis_galbana.AAC.7